ncbi:MAG: hypothetical protein VX681_05905 [Myxococcota bacterium]|nr:hypothetical protein [Myxococcota bacterium]
MRPGSLEAWVLLAVGLGWITSAGDGGVVRALALGAVGALGSAMGVAALLIPGDRRIPSHAALAFVLGLGVALVGLLVFAFGLGEALGLFASATLGLLAAGRLSMSWGVATPGVPAEDGTLAVAAKVAADEALLATFHLRLRLPAGSELRRVVSEAQELRARHGDHGFLEKPLDYHRAPPSLVAPRIESRSRLGIDYEHLRFDSEWEPASDEPGRERWLRGTANRTAHAYVVRGNPERPWLVAINGYRMGMALTDLAVFDPRVYHQRLGLNLLIPVLPMHGPRRIGALSGDGYLDADPVVFHYAEAQAMWDIRRLIGWARAQGGERIGVMGLSLGGYNAALLSSVEPGLSCVIAGIPVVDFSRILTWHSPAGLSAGFAALGMGPATLSETLRPVSPLALPSMVAPEARAVFGGVADRVVPPEHQRDLIDHWGAPRHVWYPGGHLTYMLDPAVRALVHEMLVGHLGAVQS